MIETLVLEKRSMELNGEKNSEYYKEINYVISILKIQNESENKEIIIKVRQNSGTYG
ncbi:hypothetical protein [Salipaludibacillus sp. CF4.18]|uniref:hypothetical protein n=1 Tax=Salipaludibacillus sp. CF4.18 TaxID=3373081 RepID=UPI003EE5340E